MLSYNKKNLKLCYNFVIYLCLYVVLVHLVFKEIITLNYAYTEKDSFILLIISFKKKGVILFIFIGNMESFIFHKKTSKKEG